jgi:hypothetical protein
LDDETTTQWNEFDGLGDTEVRQCLAKHIWSEPKERLARQWLDVQEAAKSAARGRETLAVAKEANDLARDAYSLATKANALVQTNNIIATFALIGAGVAIAISIVGLFLKR